MEEAVDYNPRYALYAQAHDRTPKEMLLYDALRWPGGRMAGFMLWIQEGIQAWSKENNHPRALDPNAPMWDEDMASFDDWLRKTAAQEGEEQRRERRDRR